MLHTSSFCVVLSRQAFSLEAACQIFHWIVAFPPSNYDRSLRSKTRITLNSLTAFTNVPSVPVLMVEFCPQFLCGTLFCFWNAPWHHLHHAFIHLFCKHAKSAASVLFLNDQWDAEFFAMVNLLPILIHHKFDNFWALAMQKTFVLQCTLQCLKRIQLFVFCALHLMTQGKNCFRCTDKLIISVCSLNQNRIAFSLKCNWLSCVANEWCDCEIFDTKSLNCVVFCRRSKGLIFH